MNRFSALAIGLGSVLLLSEASAFAKIKVIIERNTGENATMDFKFPTIPRPARFDAATVASVTLLGGELDPACGGLNSLTDGKLPEEADSPEENFFFQAATEGGRVRFDLNRLVDVKEINTYSWHPGSRAPQVYNLYASDGKSSHFIPRPEGKSDPEKCGWKKLAWVDTRPKSGDSGGQYAVSITGSIGKVQYLLFDFSPTETDDGFGNTFYSEIDVIDRHAKPQPTNDAPQGPFVLRSSDRKCEITIDTSRASDLTDWADHKLAPILADWYPKIVAMLPSEGYTAPRSFRLTIRPGSGVAATGGTRITANASWIRSQLNREATGSLIHETVHVVQQYGRARRANPDAQPNPGWLVEGIADYIRFFIFEPQLHGADIKPSGAERAQYDGSYRPTANFLNFVTEKYDKDIVKTLNAAMRDGNYNENIWKEKTGKTLPELGDEWKKHLENPTPAPAAAAKNPDKS